MKLTPCLSSTTKGKTAELSNRMRLLQKFTIFYPKFPWLQTEELPIANRNQEALNLVYHS